MAKYGITDYDEGIDRYLRDLYAHLQVCGDALFVLPKTYLIEKVRLRAREFNTILNDPKGEEKRKAKEAADYRKASKGG